MRKIIRFLTLSNINDTLQLMGHDMIEYKLVSETIILSSIAREAKDCHFERHIIIEEEDLLLETNLNIKQRKAYDKILHIVYSRQSGAFFINGPRELVKHFYNVLY